MRFKFKIGDKVVQDKMYIGIIAARLYNPDTKVKLYQLEESTELIQEEDLEYAN